MFSHCSKVVYNEICDAEKKRIDDNYSCITEKEIHEQSETIMRALGGRIDDETGQIRLGGIRVKTPFFFI